MNATPELVPLLVVRGAARAIDFYVETLGAKVVARYEHGPLRHVSHADLLIAHAPIAVTEEARAWNSDAPTSLGGSAVILQLCVADADAVLARMCDAGASVVFPLQELFGERMARVRDPFGHIWILRQRLQALSVEEIQRQRDELFALATQGREEAATARTDRESGDTLDDSGIEPQASATVRAPNPEPPGASERSARVHLLVGPVGAGKSTFALRLARDHAAPRFTLDAWMARLFRPDRPDAGVMEWYVERAARCIDQIWTTAQGVLELGGGVVLELGLIQRRERTSFYERVREAGFASTIYVLDAPREVRRERVEQRNRAQGSTFSMVVPHAIFELASDLWEPLDPTECEERDVRFIRTDDG